MLHKPNIEFSRKEKAAITTVKVMLKRQLTANHKLHKLVLQSGMNRTKLMQGFKAIYGITIHQFLLQQRICKARKLLVQTDYPIKAVASQSGFSSEKYFITYFKRVHVVPPGEYRKLKKTKRQ